MNPVLWASLSLESLPSHLGAGLQSEDQPAARLRCLPRVYLGGLERDNTSSPVFFLGGGP